MTHKCRFQRRTDAIRFLHELRDRLAKFGLELHPQKTRLIEFGHFAASNRARRGEVPLGLEVCKQAVAVGVRAGECSRTYR